MLTLDGRAAWKVETRFDFEWDVDRFPDPPAALAAIKAHHLRICVWEYPYVSVHSPLFAELGVARLPPDHDGRRTLRVRLGHGAGHEPVRQGADAAARERHRRFHASRRLRVVARCARALFADGVDVIKSDFGEQVPDDAVAFNGDTGRRLHNVYPLLYNQCVFEATAKYQRERDSAPMVWGRAGWIGSQRYPIQWGGDPQSDWEGLAASIRGGLSWGMSGVPYHSSDIGGFYGSQQPSAELYLRWLQAAVFSSHMRVHGIGEREPWAFGAEAEAIAGSGSRSAIV